MSGTKKSYFRSSALLVFVALSVFIYFQYPQLFDFILQPTKREIYYRDLDDREIKIADRAKSEALATQVELENSFSQGSYNSPQPFSYGFTINAAQGENLIASISPAIKNKRILFELYDSEDKFLAQSENKDYLLLEYQIDRDQLLKIVIQSLDAVDEVFNLKIYKQPQFGFPVAGKNNAAIQSFWGALRGGGSRSHEGNDIFAPRGNPVIAISESRVSSVRDRGLGGKQVWLRDDKTGNSLYYAHLDEQLVTDGASLKAGDTIGLVGNTGNARTTPPHLHFGIYKNGKAIDPKPFIWQYEIPADTEVLTSSAFAKANGNAANLRTAPTMQGTIIEDIGSSEVRLLGNTTDWFYVQALSGKYGFMHKSVLELSDPL